MSSSHAAIDALRAPLLVQELGKLELLVGVVLALAWAEGLFNATVGLARRARLLLLTGAAEGNGALLLGWERRSLQTAGAPLKQKDHHLIGFRLHASCVSVRSRELGKLDRPPSFRIKALFD